MSVKFNPKKAFEVFKEKGGTTAFPDSLKDVLEFASKDDNITTINQVAYLLATAKVESDYSLQRWEADYLCGKQGVPYKDKPCQKAINYYRSSGGRKSNYFNLGVDKNGMPYFGRGLIQLTGKANYDYYGKKIGENLVNNGDLALVPKNSYKIASEYLKDRTWKFVNSNSLTSARKSVNGGNNGLSEVNASYNFWLGILNDKSVQETSAKPIILISLGILVLIGLGLGIYYQTKSIS